ncbi:MAG: hypothetical protein DRP42_07935 [Tenericutes bacterium]|nr:MAG: hypothetical protein DRP42_07935 [Mycoplasmatota bacterium]
MKLILFGNPAIQSDSLALKVGEQLKGNYDTTHLGSPFDLLTRIENDPSFFDDAVILDVAHGIDEPKLFQDLDRLHTIRLGSLHDFDMAFFIKLLNRIGRLEPPRILALPVGMGVEEAAAAVEGFLKLE